MSAFLFLLRKSAKNYIKQLIKQPVALIFYVIIIAMIAFSMGTMFGSEPRDVPASAYLPAALLVGLFMMFYFAVRRALTSGTTVFSLEDVQLLFPAPIPPQAILLYGMVRQCGASLLMLFVIACQFGTLRGVFGISAQGYVTLLVAWFLLTLVSQIIAMTLSALLAERPRGKRVALLITNASAVAMVLAGGWALIQNPTLDAVSAVFTHSAFDFFPLAGWLRAAVMAAQNGQALISAAWMLVAAALGIAVVYLLWRANPDYYEDVLSLSQEKFEIRALAAQGRQHPSAFTRRKVRVGRSGLTGGWGASAFFFKHMTEMRREGVLFIDQKTLLTALAVGIISFSMREVFDDASTFLSIMLMGMLYMQMIFNMATGRFTQELLKPFFYLAPATARGKLIWANIQPALKATLDALVCFVAAVFLAGVDPVQAVLASLVVGLCNLLGTGGLLLSEWILGENRSKMLGAMLYFIAVIFVLAPGVVLYFVIGAVLPQLPLLPYVAFILYGVGASALLFLLLGGMLHNVETA